MLQRVVRSTVIDAPIERVWAVLRDFNSHDQWHDVVDRQPHRARREQRPGRLRAQLHAEGRQPHPRAAADAGRPRLQEHLLHPRRHGAAAALRGHRDAQAGDRRRPHLLALGIDLRHAAGHGSRAAPDGGHRRLRSRLRGPAPPPARRRRPAHARQRADAHRPAACRHAAWRCAATAGRRCWRPRTSRRRRRATARCASASARSASTTSTSTCARGWIPPMLPCRRRPACPAWKRPARCSMSAPASATCCPATASPTWAPCPAPTAACAACRPAGCCACPRRWRTRPPRRCC